MVVEFTEEIMVQHSGVARRRVLMGGGLAGVAAVTGLAVSGCSESPDDSPKWTPAAEETESPTAAAATITTPAKDATEVPAATEIVYALRNATSATVELKSADGRVIAGTPRAGGSS